MVGRRRGVLVLTLVLCALTLPMLLSLVSLPAAASVFGAAGDSYTLDEKGRRVPSPAGYVVDKIIDGVDLESGPFNNPAELFVDSSGSLFVADTDNDRIVKLTAEGKTALVIAEGGGTPLSRPQGAFVDRGGNIFVADTGNGRVVKFGPRGEFVAEFGKPSSPFLKDVFYEPSKLVVDGRGQIFAVNGSGDFRGMVTMDSKGDFRGFFAPNRVGFDWRRIVIRLFATREQWESIAKAIPPGNSAPRIDESGYVYAVTAGANKDQIKKLSSIGVNVYPSDTYGEKTAKGWEVELSRFISVGVDELGVVSASDGAKGKIYQYDQEGHLLFVIGGFGKRVGLFGYPVSVAAFGGKLFVLDSGYGVIQVFRPTRFAELVHAASKLYYDGKYEQAVGPWREVLRLNSNFSLAHRGLGKAYLKTGRLEDAMREFRYAGDKEGYSAAFREYRHRYIRGRFGLVVLWVALGIGVLYALFRIAGALSRQPEDKGGQVFQTARQVVRILVSPGETFMEIKTQGRVLPGLILLAIFFVVRSISLELTAFHYSSFDPRTSNLFLEGVRVLAPWVSWTVASYSVTTISEGKGFFKDVVAASAFSLVPYIILAIPIALLSHVLSLEESSFFRLVSGIMLAWVGYLFLVQVRVIHDYHTRKAIRVILLGLIGIGIMWGASVLFYGLTEQVYRFLGTVVSELALRI